MAPRIEVREDSAYPPGTVVIAVSPPPDAAEPRVAVTRNNAETPHLGPSGWQSSPHAFGPRLVDRGTDEVRLVFGPELTSSLDVDDAVVIALPDLGISQRVFWPEVTSVPPGTILSLGLPDRPAADVTVTRPAPPRRTSETPPEPPVQDKPVEPSPGPKRRSGLLAAIAVLVVLLLAGGAAYLWLAGTPPEDEAETLAVAPADEPAPPPPEAAPAEPAGPSLAEQYERLRTEGGHADELVVLGREALAQNEVMLGFNAVSLAADRGSRDATVQLATWYDPLQPRFDPVSPEASSAAFYYRAAEGLGYEDAAGRIERLCEATVADEHMDDAAFRQLSENPELYCN